MQLIDLMSILDENASVCIVDYVSSREIGVYNGKDSISEKLNTWFVHGVFANGKDNFEVYVCPEW